MTVPFAVLGREPVVRKRSAEEQGSKPDCRTLRRNVEEDRDTGTRRRHGERAKRTP